MAKYLQFQVRPVGSNPAQFMLVNMDEVKFLWSESPTKIVFVGNDFATEGEVCYTISPADGRGEVISYLQREWASLINSNDSIRVIPATLPLTVTTECNDNSWAEWVVQVGFDPTNCAALPSSVTIEPEGLGSVTVGSLLSIEGVTGFYATATGTPCGTQDIAFITGIECGLPGAAVPIPGLEEYFFTGKTVQCLGEEPVTYCLIAKKVYTATTLSGMLGMNKVTVPA
tara:strand:+ start:21 stop:704 length:684 start_codon:yes stop_codon:yes gene_type:complete